MIIYCHDLSSFTLIVVRWVFLDWCMFDDNWKLVATVVYRVFHKSQNIGDVSLGRRRKMQRRKFNANYVFLVSNVGFFYLGNAITAPQLFCIMNSKMLRRDCRFDVTETGKALGGGSGSEVETGTTGKSGNASLCRYHVKVATEPSFLLSI
jgi:hypothetical protein